ncbi:hypothetical protein ACQUQP_10275 [Marinobacterium sp. YM272]|uniref:hypothetical protein n=1 Tax=Marinobacterium sp. YM272 TaxID=3421654 RepID=UPI003D7FE447
MLLRGLLLSALVSLTGCSLLPPAGAGGYLEIETLAPLDPRLNESSGLALHDGRIWTINDSGNGPWLFEFDRQGQVLERTRVSAAVNIDWESLASDHRDLFVADCGNNTGRREWLQLYRIAWSELLDGADDAPVASDYIEFRLADAKAGKGTHAHDNDCEAVTWVEDRFWLFTKGWQSGDTRLYQLDPGADEQQLAAVATWPVSGLVTGADYSSDRQELVLLGYTLGQLSSDTFIWIVPVAAGRADWSGAQRHRLWPSGQWEGIAWQGNELLLTREKSILGEARLGRVRLDPVSHRH